MKTINTGIIGKKADVLQWTENIKIRKIYPKIQKMKILSNRRSAAFRIYFLKEMLQMLRDEGEFYESGEDWKGIRPLFNHGACL